MVKLTYCKKCISLNVSNGKCEKCGSLEIGYAAPDEINALKTNPSKVKNAGNLMQKKQENNLGLGNLKHRNKNKTENNKLNNKLN